MLILSSVCENFLGVIVALVATFIAYCKWSYQYWKKKNVPFLQPRVPYGNVADAILGKKNFGVAIKDIYDEMKQKGWKHGGIYTFTTPSYIPIDLEYTKNIMAKDFQYFTDRNMYYNEKEEPLMAHLVNLCGPRWKNLRTKLTPTFTSGKIRTMFETLIDCRGSLLKQIDDKCEKKEPVEIKEVLARFTTDVIGSCAFGFECKSFESENAPFRVYGKRVFYITKLQELKRRFCLNFPKLALYLNIYLTPKEITHFFTKVVKDTVEYREKNNYVRNDFMQLLIDMKNDEEMSLTVEEIAAQCYIFFLAGFETSSTLMTFALYELARNPQIQKKVRKEIEEVLGKHGGKITYESLRDMKYLSQVIDEAARMYPPFPLVNRKCVKNYKVPGEDLIIEKDTTVIIPILGIHYDKEYYPDPEKFDPERFSEEKKNSRHGYAHLPFGEGPRSCIGMRFAMMEVRLALSSLIKNYEFTVSPKTIKPIKMTPNILILTAMGEIWLNVKKV